MVVGITLPPSTLSDTYEETYDNTSATAGTNSKTFTTVSAGQVWIIEAAVSYNYTTKITALTIVIVRGGVEYVVAMIVPAAAISPLQLDHPLTLFAGDALKFYWLGCTLNDDIYARAVGVKFAIELF